jgi:hypothetical protein
MSILAVQTVIMDGNDQQQLVYYSNSHPTPYIITLKSDLQTRQYRTIGDQWKDGIHPTLFPTPWIPQNMELTSYNACIKKYEDAVNTQASHETLFKKIKKKTVDGTNNPEMKIIPAKTIIRETGFHPDILCENPHKSLDHPDGYVVNDYVGHPLDPGSPLDSDSLMMSDILNITITPRFLELFGFPSGITISIKRPASTEELFNVNIDIDREILSGTFIRTQERGVTKWIPGGGLGEFLINPGVSNKIKNKAYDLTDDTLTKQRILLIKELGDFLQVLLYFICFLWETTGPNPIDILNWKKNHSMITTDSVVYNLCKDFDLQCTYTGSTESLMSGECTLYRYLPVELNVDDCKTAYTNMVQYYIQEVIEYNTHIKIALNKIKLATTYTWGIPFMNSDGTLIIIDGFKIQHLSSRIKVNGQPGDVIIGRLEALISTYTSNIDVFNTRLNSRRTISNSHITIANFKEQIDIFKQDALLKENRTTVILTSDGVVSQITNRIVSRIYYPSPGSIFYIDICDILLNGKTTITYPISRSTTIELTLLNNLSEALVIVLNNFTKEASMRGGMFGYSSDDGINSSESDSGVSSDDENDSNADESIIMDEDPAGFYDENDSHEVRDLYTYLQNYVNYIISNNPTNKSITETDIVTYEFYEDLCLLACMTYDFNLINPPPHTPISILQIRIPVYKYVIDEKDITYYNIDETTYWDSVTDYNMVVVGKKRKTPKPKKKSIRTNKVFKLFVKPLSNLRKRITHHNKEPPKHSISIKDMVNPYKQKYEGGKRTKKRNKTKSKTKSSKKQKTSSRRTRKRHHKIK